MRTLTSADGAALLVVLTLAGATPLHAKVITVNPGESIQSAVDGAVPGTTILVSPGVYHEPGTARAVTVTRDDIRLLARGGGPVVIEATNGQTDGVWVSPNDTVGTEEDERPPCGTSNARIHRFRLQGFTVRGFERFGVYLACVDDFQVTGTVSAIDDSSITVMKGKERFQIARDKDSKMTGDAPKVGDKVTVHYKMYAVSVESKAAAPAKASKKK